MHPGCRLLGHLTFRHEMLGRYGTVVAVPLKLGDRSVESMADSIKAAVEAKTGLPLESFLGTHLPQASHSSSMQDGC